MTHASPDPAKPAVDDAARATSRMPLEGRRRGPRRSLRRRPPSRGKPPPRMSRNLAPIRRIRKRRRPKRAEATRPRRGAPRTPASQLRERRTTKQPRIAKARLPSQRARRWRSPPNLRPRMASLGGRPRRARARLGRTNPKRPGPQGNPSAKRPSRASSHRTRGQVRSWARSRRPNPSRVPNLQANGMRPGPRTSWRRRRSSKVSQRPLRSRWDAPVDAPSSGRDTGTDGKGQGALIAGVRVAALVLVVGGALYGGLMAVRPEGEAPPVVVQAPRVVETRAVVADPAPAPAPQRVERFMALRDLDLRGRRSVWCAWCRSRRRRCARLSRRRAGPARAGAKARSAA